MFAVCTVPVPTPALLELLDCKAMAARKNRPRSSAWRSSIGSMSGNVWLARPPDQSCTATNGRNCSCRNEPACACFIGQTARADCAYAEVVGDKIMYQGRPVSPYQFATAFAGSVRNAWHDLTLRLPGEKNWKPASVRCREIKLVESQ